MHQKVSILLFIFTCAYHLHITGEVENQKTTQAYMHKITKENIHDLLSKNLIPLKSDYTQETAQALATLEREYSVKGKSLALEQDKHIKEKIAKDISDITYRIFHIIAKTTSSVLHTIFDAALIELLINAGADINDQDIQGKTPLYFAIDFNNMPVAQLLLTHGADPNIKTYAFWKTPLHLAIEQQNKDNLIELLLAHKADVNARDYYEQTPLHYAVVHPHNIKIVTLLVEHGADIHAQDKNGNTPLHRAVPFHGREVITYLLQKGARKDTKNRNGKTPHEIAVTLSKQLNIPDNIIKLLQ